MTDMKFKIGDKLRIKVSSEVGTVRAVAIWDDGPPQYFLFYKAADGRAVESWWTEAALTDDI